LRPAPLRNRIAYGPTREKKKMKGGFHLAFGALLLVGAALPAQALIIAIDPSSQSVQVGATTTADLVISRIGDAVAPSLEEFDLDVSFDPSILSFSGPILGNLLERLTFMPALPHQRFLVFCAIDPRTLPQWQRSSCLHRLECVASSA